MEKNKCMKCNKRIYGEDKYVLLGTYFPSNTYSPSKKDEKFFHFKCFVEWYHGKVEEKSRNIVKNMQEKAQRVLADVINMSGRFPGLDQLQSMLNLDLNKKEEKDGN